MHKKISHELIVFVFMIFMLAPLSLSAKVCSDKLFSVTIDSSLSIGDALENLVDTCSMSLIVRDAGARAKLKQNLYYVKLRDATLESYLDTIVSENGLHYELDGNKLIISYLMTRTFKIHYISSSRSGRSRTDIVVADSDRLKPGHLDRDGSGISITSNDKFTFWETVKEEVKKILLNATGDDIHYTKVGNGWIGPDGKKWNYNPLEPVVNPQAGMITVTGTAKQLKRVARYVASMTKQLKEQVLIDVRILTVTFHDAHTTGIDWSQLYGLQNLKIDASFSTTSNTNISNGNTDSAGAYQGSASGSSIKISSQATVSEVIKFLGTQGEVRSISSPRVRTLNNQQAVISVGKELFYKIRTSTKLDGNTAEGEQINSVFAGVLLDITPEVDARGMITLKINPSITETLEPIKGGGTRSIPPDLIRRQIASVIKVRDGHHAILGGLISTKCDTKTSKVPLLGDLPLLGSAFKRKTKINTTEEMVIIITPHIIKDRAEPSLEKLGYRRLDNE